MAEQAPKPSTSDQPKGITPFIFTFCSSLKKKNWCR